MKTEILKFIYNGEEVEFEISKKNLMVNATEMAKIFMKDVYQYTRIDSTKEFLQACLKPQFCGLLGVEKEEDLIISKQRSGTWMHRIIALDFASWLSPEFKIWLLITIDNILNQYFKESKEAFTQEMTAKEKLDKARKELKEKYSDNKDIIELLELEELYKMSRMKRVQATKNQYKQMKLDLFD